MEVSSFSDLDDGVSATRVFSQSESSAAGGSTGKQDGFQWRRRMDPNRVEACMLVVTTTCKNEVVTTWTTGFSFFFCGFVSICKHRQW